MPLPERLGKLRKAVGAGRLPHRSVKLEMRENLARRLRGREPLFPGIVGYDESVIPQIVNAVLSQHDFVLLGLRGQAKTRLLRALVSLLDEAVAVMPDARSTTTRSHPCAAHAAPGWRRPVTISRSPGSRGNAGSWRSWRRRTSRSPT